MRILQVRFKNLNSLVGEWSIDLSDPAYAADGIFAITGPTGAGKSTILDAICLALYGRTPRLSKVTKSGNEVMSRQTGECFAETVFETQAGRFRCHWSQRRARKKADGELQAPKHEIANADTGQIFEAKLRGVAEQIESCTGMDFDRFTRSMLLAQGGFAAFLQAAADERAPILEQITGTEIYSQISVRVHELRKNERDALDRLRAELQGMQPLGEEEVRALSDSLAQKSRREGALGAEIARHGQAIAWLDGIALLEKELQEIGEQQRLWHERQEAFTPRQQALQRAGQALELTGDHAGLSALRREQLSVQQSHADCLTALPARAAVVQAATEGLQQAVALLDGKKAAHKEAQPILRQVRELDLRLREKVAPLTAAAAAVTEGEKALALLRSKQEADGRLLGEANNSLTELLCQLDQCKADQGLVEDLARILDRFDGLTKLNGQQAAKGEEVRLAEAQTAESLQLWNEQVAKEEAARQALAAIQQSHGQKQLALGEVLDGRTLPEWRSALTAWEKRKIILDRIGEALRSTTEARQVLDAASESRASLSGEQGTVAVQLQTQLEKGAGLEREIQLLETQALLLKRIQSFESARQQLRDGEPCLLCGATEHPFAAGNIPVPEAAEADLVKIREEYRQNNALVSGLKVRQAEIGKDLEQIAARQAEWNERLAVAQAATEQGCRELAIGEEEQKQLTTMFPQRQQEATTAVDRAARIVQRSEVLEQEIGALRDAVEERQAAVVQAERRTQEALHRRESAEQAVARAKAEAEMLAGQFRQDLAELQSDLFTYGIEALSFADLARVRSELTRRREEWLRRQQEKTALEQCIAALEIELRHRQEQLQKDEADLGQGREVLQKLREEEQALRGDRRQLFGDQDPDAEEARLTAAFETAEKGVETARQALEAAGRQLDALHCRTTELADSLTKRTEQLNDAAAAFMQRLAAAGFADEEAFVAACLPEEERKRLLRQAQELTSEQAELASREKEKTLRLAAERQKATTNRPRLELEELLHGLSAEQKEMQQEIGAIRQKLRDNEALAEKQKERMRALELQKEECSRWDLLHELIGSSDGKKFRNFAQGLTFEMMVGHANRQLRKMTDRYLLIRDTTQPLDLNIIDSYQAGEIRSTKNLSGGESFIVSLALALGLSQMASRNIRVDSLFLDEGFGTLDDEALSTALETLAGLQQDGKLIGVISHVQALKDRIATQIQVQPISGGRSAISGPGCKKADQQLTAAA